MSSANLLYLTIYNPTLRPIQSTTGDYGDEEDAGEQAHILFYTSKEHVVSRDRMLRQVGLAKALISFSEIFNPEDPCSSVHSQSRRMIMVTPEPNFWIHAGVELLRTQKNRLKGKEGSKGKEINYEYHDASVHDLALKADIIRGYERFKLLHGSFSSILSHIGQEALELQLERFFTVWAWSWNLADGSEFSDHFGVPFHPLSSSLKPSIDAFAADIPEDYIPLIVTPAHMIPSTRYNLSNLPGVLPQHLQSLLNPLPVLPVVPPKQEASEDGSDSNGKILGIPSDLRKWSWPDYLTFGKSNGQSTVPLPPPDPRSEGESRKEMEHPLINASALEDAMSEQLSVTPPEVLSSPESQPLPDPPPQLASTFIYLTRTLDGLVTDRRTVLYLSEYPILVALINMSENDEEASSSSFSQAVKQMLNYTLSAIERDSLMSSSTETIPSATKILQPRDRYMIHTPMFTSTSDNFTSKSVHLYNSRQIFDTDDEVEEVFSRGQNPQYWHIAKRCLDAKHKVNEIYMEVLKKETSLTDVDNSLASLVRKNVNCPIDFP